ncbi:MAG: flagellar hook capping FlgD N-terminal domain-containing protein [Deltaproteobacteria bacterium]
MIDGVTSLLNASSASSTSSTSSTSDTLGKDDFLTLLVTQLENQDPLEPMDNTEFVAQLAQFSSLEGITNLNTTMSGMSGSLTSMQNYSTASLIGKYVKTEGGDIYFTGSQANFGYTIDAGASSVTVSILDSSGATVSQMDLGAQNSGSYDLAWDGTDSSGNTLQNGTYTFSVDAKDSTGQSITASTYTIDGVLGVTFDSTGAASLAVGDRTVTMDEVEAIY